MCREGPWQLWVASTPNTASLSQAEGAAPTGETPRTVPGVCFGSSKAVLRAVGQALLRLPRQGLNHAASVDQTRKGPGLHVLFPEASFLRLATHQCAHGQTQGVAGVAVFRGQTSARAPRTLKAGEVVGMGG